MTSADEPEVDTLSHSWARRLICGRSGDARLGRLGL
jgi:hypothetical protein